MRKYFETGTMGRRKFSVITLDHGQILTLSSEDLLRLHLEFPTAFYRLYDDSRTDLKELIAHHISSYQRQENDMVILKRAQKFKIKKLKKKGVTWWSCNEQNYID
jgi:hypothetical protein